MAEYFRAGIVRFGRTRVGMLLLVTGLLLGGLPTGVGAQDGVPSDEGALFLLLPVGAQGVSTGRTMTSVPSPESAFWNPAGLGGLEESRLMVFRGDQVAGQSTALSGIWTYQPIGVFGLSWQLLDGGSIDLTDDQGTVVGEINLRSHLGIASFGTRLLPWLQAGVNLKLIRENFDCRASGSVCEGLGTSSTGWALDAGLQIPQVGRLPIRLGAMVAHVGPDFQVENASQSDPLPSRLRLSAGYDALSSLELPDLHLWFTVEVEDRLEELGENRSIYFGTEFEAGRGDQIFVRAGYVDGEVSQADGFAVGVGLRYERFDLALGKNLAGSITGESEPVHVSFGVVF